ncbi:hypothetical protein BLNAU_11768 [Blattamonas nauphoetae]|uniref:Uncharacterized protein n=1 Tax=Blattamonas nauphoetae TaxID=2049346 RepID=A0ABQ9XS96_9EUKA|nr:hypothetical protein BLNAU_11768 [Blattamonas nauphoetae]
MSNLSQYLRQNPFCDCYPPSLPGSPSATFAPSPCLSAVDQSDQDISLLNFDSPQNPYYDCDLPSFAKIPSATFTPPTSPSAACQPAFGALFPSQCFQQTLIDADLGAQSDNQESWTDHNQVDDTILGESLSAQNPSPQQDERNEAVNDRAEMKQGSFSAYYGELRPPVAYRSFPPLTPTHTGTAQPHFASQNQVADYPNTGRSRTWEGTKPESANAQIDGAPAKEPVDKQVLGHLAGLSLNEEPFVEATGKSYARLSENTLTIELMGVTTRRSVEIDRELEEKGIVGRNEEIGSGQERHRDDRRRIVQIGKDHIEGMTMRCGKKDSKTVFVWLSFLVRDEERPQQWKKGKKYNMNLSSDLLGLVGPSVRGRGGSDVEEEEGVMGQAVRVTLLIERKATKLDKLKRFLAFRYGVISE